MPLTASVLMLHLMKKIFKPNGCLMNRQASVYYAKKNSEYSAESTIAAVVVLWSAGNAPLQRCMYMDIRIKKCAFAKLVRTLVRRDRSKSKIEASSCLRELQEAMAKSRQPLKWENKIRASKK